MTNPEAIARVTDALGQSLDQHMKANGLGLTAEAKIQFACLLLCDLEEQSTQGFIKENPHRSTREIRKSARRITDRKLKEARRIVDQVVA